MFCLEHRVGVTELTRHNTQVVSASLWARHNTQEMSVNLWVRPNIQAMSARLSTQTMSDSPWDRHNIQTMSVRPNTQVQSFLMLFLMSSNKLCTLQLQLTEIGHHSVDGAPVRRAAVTEPKQDLDRAAIHPLKTVDDIAPDRPLRAEDVDQLSVSTITAFMTISSLD